MKIGMIVNNLEVSGGYQKLVIRLAQSLERKGHKVTIYTPALDTKNCYPDDIASLNIVAPEEVAKLPNLKDQMEALAPLLDPGLDILIIHDPDCLNTLDMISKKDLPKVIWMLNNQLPDIYVPYGSCVRLSLQKTKGLNPYARFKIALDDCRALAKLRAPTKKVDVFATYDNFNKQLVEGKLGRSATIVLAGADLDEFTGIKRGSRTTELTRIELLSVGVAFPHRRYEDIIKAVPILKKQHTDVHLTIVGRHDLHPTYATSLKKLVSKLRLGSNVTFVEYAPQKQLMKLYRDCDTFLFVNDGFTWGISVFEAVAARIPVVITNNIGASDLISNSRTGWVVPPRKPDAIAAAVSEIATNPKLVNNVVKTAYADISELLTWDSYADRLLDPVL